MLEPEITPGATPANVEERVRRLEERLRDLQDRYEHRPQAMLERIERRPRALLQRTAQLARHVFRAGTQLLRRHDHLGVGRQPEAEYLLFQVLQLSHRQVEPLPQGHREAG